MSMCDSGQVILIHTKGDSNVLIDLPRDVNKILNMIGGPKPVNRLPNSIFDFNLFFLFH